jgi:putative PIN family toxin of toxin-antitoxin system
LIGASSVRFVLDTNLLVSGVIAAGLPRRLIDGAKAGEFELCTSEVLLAELLDVLSRENFVTRLSQAGLTPQGIVDDLRRLAVVVSPTDVPRVVPTDPDDDHVIAAAVAGQVDLIASGDKRDLLPMGSFQGIPIITARAAVERLEARSKA